MSERTVQNLEAGKRPQPLIRGKIEKALGWEPGEMRRIADSDREPDPDVLAERWGAEDAERVRRVMARHGDAGKALLREMEREFRTRGEAESSGPRRAVG